MNVKEREGAKAGGYDVVFLELIRKGNKVGLSGKGEDGRPQRAMFRLTTDKGVKVPYSFPWDPDHPVFKATLGVLGVPVEKLGDLGEVEAALIKFEKLAKAKALPCNVFVYEDGGFGSGLKPLEGKYLMKFSRIASRDKETDRPIHVHYGPKVRQYKRGGQETIDEEQFKTEFVIVAGERKGALVKRTETYAILKDPETDEWYVDGESSPRHAAFRRLMKQHNVPIEKINPDKHFADPENGCPELEKLMLKGAKVMEGTIEKGFINKLDVAADGVGETIDIGPEEYQAENIGELFDVIDQRVQKTFSKSAWQGETGQFTKAGRIWTKKHLIPLLQKKSFPTSLRKLTDEHVDRLVKILSKE